MDSNSYIAHFLTDEIYVVDDVANANSSANSTSAEQEQVVELAVSGKGLKGVMVLVNYETTIPIRDLEFLHKILAAVKLSPDDIYLVNLSLNYTAQHIDQLNQLKHNYIISFGATQEGLVPASASFYEVLVTNRITTLLGHALSEINADTEKKKQLWKQLQTIFQS